MLRWDHAIVAEIDAVLAQARAGQPSIVVVDGEPGIGKSSLLEEITERAADFRRLFAEGVESATAVGYGLLQQLGVPVATDGDEMSPTSAAQALREILDEVSRDGPVLVVIDDIQWADPESVDTLIEVVGRASGDALLLVVGSRVLTVEQLPRWRHWISRPGRVRAVHLTGLSLADATEFVQELRPGVSAELAKSLWQHTGGHPLYLRALVSEYDGPELAAMGVLPAPAEFVQTVRARMQRISPPARELGQALGVLGTSWVNLRDAALVSGVDDPSAAVQELIDARLVDLRSSALGETVRPTHALVRSAIYQGTALMTRRRLHSKAATVVSGASAVLDHRLAGTDQYDDELAGDLEAHALGLHDQRAFRQAAHYLAAASTVSSDPAERQRRWLDALFDTLLSGDRATVRAAVPDIDEATDLARRDLVLGALAQWDRRPFEALEVLGRWAGRGTELATGTTPTAQRLGYRIEALIAWAGIFAGSPEGEIGAALHRAAQVGVEDPAVRRLARVAAGQLAARHVDDIDALPDLRDLPVNPAAVPNDSSDLLAWRGTVRSAAGRFPEARDDLTEVTGRIQRGLHEPSGGVFHAMLAHAQWFLGDWSMSRLNFRIAVEMGNDLPHPVVQAIVPLAAIGDGRLDEADAALDEAGRTIERLPWQEAVDLLTVTEVVRRHAADQPVAGPNYFRIGDTVQTLRGGNARRTPVWLMHAALAATWAGELDDARFCTGLVAAVPVRWTVGITEWLHGLIAEAEGDGGVALTRLRNAVAEGPTELPLYRAHIHADHARIAALLGDPDAAARSLDVAADQYRRLGATRYLDRTNTLRTIDDSTGAAVAKGSAYGLSDRERDVVTLLATGMSYAQIARALFITRSTVSYHLGNIYAKTNVGSRHELSQLAHTQPSAFGLAQTA